MKDKSKKLLVINTGKKGASTASDTSGSSASFKGGSPMALNMSEYLLKAIWNKAFEIKTDERGNEYLFSKLPLATQYGITMYADGGELNLPDIYAGIPFDNKSIWYNPETKQVEVLGGNGSSGEGGVSNFWDLNGIPGWITNTKPTYNYSEIKNTPDLSEFVSSDDLKKYVSLDGNETINGLKNFTKGLQIDGLGITKLQDDVVYLDAHLVVRGGITMFGTGEDVDVPTIMDALSVDGVNLQVINGVLTFVGEATGGVADSVRWENVIGKPSFASVATSGKYSDLIGRPTLLSSFTDDVVAGKYLPLSGGTISNSTIGLTINRTTANTPWILFQKQGANVGRLGMETTGPVFYDIGTNSTKTIYHSGNFTPSNYLPLTGGTVGELYVGGESVGTGHLSTRSSKARLALISFTDGHNYIESGNSDFSANAPLRITGKSAGLGSDLYLFFNNIYCRGNNYINIDSGNYSSYALPLDGGKMNGSIELSAGSYIKNPATTYAILGVSVDNKVICGEPANPLYLRGTQVEIPQKTFIEGNGANVLTLKRNNAEGGAFVFYKALNQDNIGWIAGVDSEHDFIFNYTTDGLATHTYMLRLTNEGHLINRGNVVIGSVSRSDNVVALNVYGKGWFSNGVKLHSDSSSYNTNGITFSSAVGGSILGRIGGDTSGNISIFPTGNFIVRPGYTGTGVAYGLKVTDRGTNEIDYTTNQVGLWIRQKSALSSWIAYAPNNQNNNIWVTGVDTDNIFRCRYSTDALATTPSTKMALNTNGLLSTLMGLQVNGAAVISSSVPSIAMPYSSYISFGGFHALRGETNAVVLASPTVNGKGKVILRPNGNASTQYQMSINDLGETTLSCENAACLTLNRTATSGGAYVRFNPKGQSTYGWIVGSSSDYKCQAQYWNGNSYQIKAELDYNANLLVYGGITMYSDQRKKTILNHVELSLKQVADAPLIEHYYNSDDSKTTHVGSIAQYWAEMNDWFCKKDNEGFYTMEVQNAALASAISIARELVKYESKTDKKIRLLKKRVSELEDEIEKLKRA